MGINIKSQEQYFIHVHEGISDPVSRLPLLPSKQITITKAPYAKSCTSVKWANKNWKYNKIWTKMLIQKHWFAKSYNLYIISFMINVNKEQWCIVNESQPNDDVWHSYKIVIFTYTMLELHEEICLELSLLCYQLFRQKFLLKTPSQIIYIKHNELDMTIKAALALASVKME